MRRLDAHRPGDEDRIVFMGCVIISTVEDAYSLLLLGGEGTKEANKANFILNLSACEKNDWQSFQS